MPAPPPLNSDCNRGAVMSGSPNIVTSTIVPAVSFFFPSPTSLPTLAPVAAVSSTAVATAPGFPVSCYRRLPRVSMWLAEWGTRRRRGGRRRRRRKRRRRKEGEEKLKRRKRRDERGRKMRGKRRDERRGRRKRGRTRGRRGKEG
ncbi:unnamed protein product [Closterium sp. NIES-54]